MSFLDDIISEGFGVVSEQTTRRLNMMISMALISSEERLKYEMESWKYTEEEAKAAIKKLESCMPIVGYHTLPTNVGDAAEATRLRVERDDFQEQRWKK
jgi:hypothetical protein